MSSLDNLVLHLKLDHLVETNKVIDEKSGTQYTISGHPQIVLDDMMVIRQRCSPKRFGKVS